jgi:hypothetical protein
MCRRPSLRSWLDPRNYCGRERQTDQPYRSRPHSNSQDRRRTLVWHSQRMEPGEYFLGANAFSSFRAPDAERPFATAYYPAAENESEAAVVKVVRSSPLRLSPLRLRKLEVVTIQINVLWADGTRSERSNIYFKNVLYPRHGGTAPQIDNGTG